MKLLWVLWVIPVFAGILFARNRRENRLRSQEMNELEDRLQVLRRLNAEGETSQEEFGQKKKDLE